MYLRKCYRTKNGKRHAYWALVESYRTARGPRQRVVAYLGEMDAEGRVGVQASAEGTSRNRQKSLFEPAVEPEWVEVDLRGVRGERSRKFGGPWLALELLRKLGLVEFLAKVILPGAEDISWSVMALIRVIQRLCDASSELYIAEHGYEQSALEDLVGVPSEKVNDDRLYRALDQANSQSSSLASQGEAGDLSERAEG